MSKIYEIQNAKDLYNILTTYANRLIVIDFYAPWCGPCKRLSAYLEQNISKYPNIIFLKINIDNDNCSEIVEKFKVTNIPRIIMFYNKTLVHDITGFKETELQNILNKY